MAIFAYFTRSIFQTFTSKATIRPIILHCVVIMGYTFRNRAFGLLDTIPAVTDRRTDTSLSQRPRYAYCRAGKQYTST